MPSDDDVTPPMGLTVGDRVALDKKIDLLKQKHVDHVEARRAADETFNATRMLPLETTVTTVTKRQGLTMTLAIVAVCVAGASLLVQLARILAMGPSR